MRCCSSSCLSDPFAHSTHPQAPLASFSGISVLLAPSRTRVALRHQLTFKLVVVCPPPSYASASGEKAPESKFANLLRRFCGIFQRKRPNAETPDLGLMMAEQVGVEPRRLVRQERRQETEVDRRVLETDEAFERAKIRHHETFIRSEEATITHADVKTKALKLERAQEGKKVVHKVSHPKRGVLNGNDTAIGRPSLFNRETSLPLPHIRR